MFGRKVTIYLDDGESWETRLSDEEIEILAAEVEKMDDVFRKMEAKTGKEMPRYTLAMEMGNAIHEHAKRLKMDQHSGNCGGPENK